MNYEVTWIMEVTGETPEDAAKAAMAILRNPISRATILRVVDLKTGVEGLYDAEAKPPRKLL